MDCYRKITMIIGTKGIALIKQFEGCVLHVYKDVAGLNTIGYGHLIKPGERFTTITQAQAEALLHTDVRPFETCVGSLVKVPLNQNQFDALVCFAYNVGCGNLASSTLLKFLNAGDMKSAAEQFLVWNKARVNGKLTPVVGLTNRRVAEKALFLS